MAVSHPTHSGRFTVKSPSSKSLGGEGSGYMPDKTRKGLIPNVPGSKSKSGVK